MSTWAPYLDDGDSFDLTDETGEVIACTRKPPVPKDAGYPWYAGVRLSSEEWDMGILGYFPCEKFARMAADAYVKEKQQ